MSNGKDLFKIAQNKPSRLADVRFGGFNQRVAIFLEK
jgi:hypothetical protein